MATKQSKQEPALVQWINRQVWIEGADLETEYVQAQQEGRDLTSVEADFKRLLAVPMDSKVWGRRLSGARDLKWYEAVGELLDRVQTLPIRTDYKFREPSDLAGIQKARRRGPKLAAWKGSKARYLEKLHGGLLARICGCMLGKPIEGWKSAEIKAIAVVEKNWPLRNYLRMPSPAEAKLLAQGRTFNAGHKPCLLGTMNGMVEDDDINYTTIGLRIVRDYGKNFSPLDVATAWCQHLPLLHTCTAERVAYRNFLQFHLPPESATCRNPYREWIGAQIRADYFGYANPGHPARAAAWAWRDASISHVKNGIYGAMWVAALLAAAYVVDDVGTIIRAGLAQIPAQCRLVRDVETILAAHAAGRTYDEAVRLIQTQWNEHNSHDWCHTNSNAMIVAAALLYGGSDFAKTITYAVMPGFDTDCNGATAGSVWGIVYGAKAVPAKWKRPIKDTVRTGVADYHQLKISQLAAEMVDVALRNF